MVALCRNAQTNGLPGGKVMNINLRSDQRIPDGFFDHPLPILRVLYEAEQPIVYVTQTKQGQELLAYLADETATHQYVIVAPTSPNALRNLEAGSIGVREALTDTWMWLVRVGSTEANAEAWSIVADDVPAGHLPRPGTPLLPEHQIAFSAKAVGDDIRLGSVPSSVVSFVAEAARSSLKAILDHVMAVRSEGRPSDARRALYDLPVQQIRCASFEIGLAAPPDDLFQNESVAQALSHLAKGLAWAEMESDTAELIADGGEVEELAILRATLALTPPTSGVITGMEVSGHWLNGRRYYLSKNSRAKVSRRLRRLQTEEIVVHRGRIGEIDDDKLSFTLRDVDGGSERKGTFPEILLDDMRTHYYEATRIEISGVVRNGKLHVTAVVDIPEAQV